MKKQKNFLNRKEIISFLIILGVVLAFFGINLKMDYAPDTYATYSMGWKEAAKDTVLRNGRVVVGIVYWVNYALDLSIDTFYVISYIYAILLLSLAIYLLNLEMLQYGIKRITGIVIASAIIVNPFLIGYFMFIEKGTYAFAIFMVILALRINNRSRKRTDQILVVLCLLISVFTYQAAAVLYIGIMLPFIEHKSNKIKEYVANVIATCVEYFIAGFANFIFVKVVTDSGRVPDDANIISNIRYILKELLPILRETFGIIPKGVYGCLLLVTIIISIIKIRNNALLGYINILAILLATIVGSVVTIILGAGELLPRVIYPMGACIGILILNLVLNAQEGYNIKFVYILMVVFLLLLELVGFSKIFVDRQRVTKLDKNRVDIIAQAIEEYEVNSGQEVSHIVVYNSRNLTRPQYKEINSNPMFSESAFSAQWSDTSVLEYYMGRHFFRTDGEICDDFDEQIKVFSSVSKDNFSEEQIRFDGQFMRMYIY